jgi:hypothetical protein
MNTPKDVLQATASRNCMPNRRAAITFAFERDNSHYQATVGYFPDGRIGELFLNADRANSLLDFLTSDAAILLSLALQWGCPLDDIRHALKRTTSGEAASPIGLALGKIP